MGEVWRAHDPVLKRNVAVKLMLDAHITDPSYFERFEREAQHAASLEHPNVVMVYDYGIDDRTPFIVMQLIEGQSLKDELIAAPMGRVEALGVVKSTLAGLDHAHQRGLIHRDIKPANILLDRAGTVKVTDFGIAKAPEDVTLTHTGAWLGTVSYASPEQISGGAVGKPSDLYSVGCVLFECLAGRPPFEGRDLFEIASKQKMDPPPTLRGLGVDVPEALESTIARSLRKDPRERFGSAREMAAALEGANLTTLPRNVVVGGTIPVPSMRRLDAPIEPTERAPDPTNSLTVVDPTYRETQIDLREMPPERKKRRILPSLVIAALLLVTLGLAAAWLIFNPDPDPGSRERVGGNAPGDAPRNAPLRLRTFSSELFDIKVPRNWNPTAVAEDSGKLIHTQIEDPNQSSTRLIVDIVTDPGEPRDPQGLLAGNRENLSSKEGFREIGAAPFDYGNADGTVHEAVLWEFVVEDPDTGVLLHKIDVFFQDDRGNGVAVLVAAPEAQFDDLTKTFRRMRNSLVYRGPPASQPPIVEFDRFENDLIAIDHPIDWEVTERVENASDSTLVRTDIGSVEDPLALVRTDVLFAPISDTTPAALLDGPRNALSSAPGFQELATTEFVFTHADGEEVQALRWEFLVEDPASGRLLHKIDVFFQTVDGAGYAILRQAPEDEFGEWLPTFERMLQSFEIPGEIHGE